MLLEESFCARRRWRPKGEASVPEINFNHAPSLSKIDPGRGQLIFQNGCTLGEALCLLNLHG